MGILFIGRVMAFAFTFAVPLVLVRIFTPESFGLYKQLFLIYSTFTAMLTFGFSGSLFYFLPKFPTERSAYITQTLLVLSTLGVLGAVILLSFREQIAAGLNNPALSSYIPYLAIFVVLSLVTEILETLMLTLKRAALAAVTCFASELFKGSLMIAAALLTHSMMILLFACVIWSACRVLALLVYLRKVSLPVWTIPSPNRLVKQFKYAMPFGMALIVRTLTDSLPQFAVSYLYDPVVFAIYSVGYLQIPAVSIAAESIADVTLVKLTELRNAGAIDSCLNLLGGSVVKLCLLLFPLYIWLMVNARDLIVLLFTDKFEASVDLFKVFLTTIPLTAIALDYVPRAFADTAFVLRVNILRIAVTLVLLLIFLPLFGLIGAAAATVLGIGITKLVILQKVKVLVEANLKSFLPWSRIAKIGVAAGGAGVAALIFQATVTMPVVIRLGLSATLFSVIYGALVWSMDVLERTEKDTILGWLLKCGISNKHNLRFRLRRSI
jgi:O-antigen/teichoic acid export membrane protein